MDMDMDIDMDNITKYRQIALKFIEVNKQNLVSIYLHHSNGTEENEGPGILVITINEINNINVSFLPFTFMNNELYNQIYKLQETNNENIIYCKLDTPYEHNIIEIDIRTLTT